MTKNVDNSLQNQIIAMSNTLAEKSTQFNAVQQKLFYVSLAALKHGKNSNNEVTIDKKELIEYLGFENDTSKYTRLRYQFKKLMINSFVQFGTDEEFIDGVLITLTRSDRYNYYVKFNDYFTPLLEELADNYVRLLDDDVTSFDSKFSMMLYQNLLKDKWKLTNPDFFGIDYSTRKLKSIFGLSKDDYVRKDNHFDRYTFEHTTIDKAIKEINEKSRCISNLSYKKLKKGNRVHAYIFSFEYCDPQDVVEKVKKEKRLEALAKASADSRQMTLDDYRDNVKYSDDVKNLEWWNM